MQEHMSQQTVAAMREEASEETQAVIKALENDYPGISEGLATALGAGTGAAGSFAALTFLGVSGLSAAGITSGLAAAGALVGGGMVAGIGVLAAPVAALGVLGYALAKKHKNARLAVALGTAIEKLFNIQTRLMKNAEYFKDEIATIKATIEFLKAKQA